MNRSQRRKYSRQVEKINRGLEDIWLVRVQKAIQAKASVAISRLREGGTSGAFRYLSEDIGNPALTNVISSLYRSVGLIHARRTSDMLRSEPRVLKSINLFNKPVEVKRIGFNEEWAAFINEYLRKFLLEKITYEVNETTKAAMLKVLQQGINEGLGVDDIIRRLEDWPFARFQAARIVRTEITRATNVGALAGGSTFKFEQQKEWISAMDNRTRGTNPKDHANHRELDGNVVNEDGVFVDQINGDQLRFPGDPEASAASTVNCRCHIALVAKRDERGRLIPKSRVTVIQPGQIRRPQNFTI